MDASSKSAHDAPTPLGMNAPAPTGAGPVSSFLLARGMDLQREGTRIVAGFALLLALGVTALNVTLWHNAGRRIETEAWARLEAAAEVRRGDVDHLLRVTRREALSVAHDPYIANAVRSLPGLPAGEARAAALSELYERAQEFEFTDVLVLGAAGEVLSARRGGDLVLRADAMASVAEARTSGDAVWIGLDGTQLALAVLAPARDHGVPQQVIVFHADAAQTLMPLLQQWPGFGTSSGAYIVRTVGSDVEVLTPLENGRGYTPGTRLPMSGPGAMAAAMAATRVASRVEIPGSSPRVWAVTRPLDQASWGIVAQADRSELMSGMSSVRQALVSLDLILAGVFFAIVLVWRRSYTSGLARREVEITERHAKRLQSILDTAFDAIFTFDRIGRVKSANRAAEALVGWPLAAIESQPIQRILTWGVAGRPLALPQSGAVVEGHALCEDGSRIPVEFSMGRSGTGDELVFTAIVRDMRDRVEAERRIREFAEGLEHSNRRLEEMNAQLEEASRLKSEFLANTSHELRTPLNGMIGFLQLVLDGMCDSREEEQEFQRQALQCSRHLLGLINDVLDIAKIEAGKLTLEIGRLDLQQLFDEVYTVTHVQSAQKGLQLKFEDQVPYGVAARGDFGKIKQVLINLIGNSLKFTPKGEICVRAKAHPDLGHLLIEVQDTGIGIPEDRQKLVFDKFVQGDGSTTRRFGGTGLGLSISKSLVELMGGIIGVHSDGENKGTKVYFSLPLWRDESEPAVPALEQIAEHVQGTAGDPLVLVVEDDPVFRRFVTAVLQRGGYRTVEAEHAEEAWEVVRRLRPAVVVLDYALSCADGAALRTGWDLAKRMTAEPETRHIPVVFVTGFDGELKQRLQSTAFARRPEHLVKPVEPSTLIARITELAGTPAPGRVIRVLMADDDPTVASYVRKVLPPDRFVVDVASNGEECLHRLRTQIGGYDLLMLDLMMPEVSGYDVLREMTLTGLQPDLPVMVLTNFPEPRNAEEKRLLEQGLVLDVIAKTAVHDNPQLLPHVLDWHLQVARGEVTDTGDAPGRRAA
ncbi:MAG: response regulator [Candidatus Eisenbacteria bacterium]